MEQIKNSISIHSDRSADWRRVGFVSDWMRQLPNRGWSHRLCLVAIRLLVSFFSPNPACNVCTRFSGI